MTSKSPVTIRFPAVPASGPPASSWPAPPPSSPDHETEPSISLPRPSVRDRASIVLLTGPSAGEIYTLGADGETTFGRDPACDLSSEDAAISRKHARVTQAHGEYVLEDLDSTNGTYVSGERVARRVLRSGDQIQLGPHVLYRFAMTDETEERLQRQLYESSIRDPLTHAYNKKYINERLAAEVAHAKRHATKLALLMLDLDDFKKTNDRHGHLAGDAVLKAVAQTVASHIRIEDVFARFGGEEFMVLTRGDGVRNATQLAERLRRAIEAVDVRAEGAVLKVSVSIGVAELEEASEPTPRALVERADARLYRAKALGRNRVVHNDA